MKKIFFLLLTIVLLLSSCKPKTDAEQLPQQPDTLLSGSTNAGQEQPAGQLSPPLQGTLPSGIAYTELEQLVDDFMASNEEKIAAVSIAVFTRDEVLLEKAYGYLNVEDKVGNDADAVFDWWSIGKTLAWVSAMQLAEQGNLDLDADIRTYLPDNFFSKLQYDEPITMLHLMSHTTGWERVTPSQQFLGTYSEAPELGDALRELEPVQSFCPGENQNYNNYHAALAAYIVECITGRPFFEYVQSNTFDALGITKTALTNGMLDNEWEKKQRENLRSYRVENSLLSLVGANQYSDKLHPGGRAATGTVSDLRRYAQALLADEHGFSPLFEKPETLAELYTPTYIPPTTLWQSNHGFFLLRAELDSMNFGENIIGHCGESPGSWNALFIDIDNGIGVVIMTNTVTDGMVNGALLSEEMFSLIFAVERH